MSFSRVIGQQRAKDILRRALEHQRTAHAYLFSGPEGVGKEALAVEFAKALLCQSEDERPCDECLNCRRASTFQHPDFTFLFPSSAKTVDEDRGVLDSLMAQPYLRLRPWAAPTIGIEQIRALRRNANLKPLEGRQVVVIADADRMTNGAANALLKLLEEPPATLTLLLTVTQTGSLLPTITSRCQEIRLSPLTDNEIEWALVEREGMDPARAQLLARVSQGSYRRALEWAAEDFNQRREDVLAFLRACLRDPYTQITLIESLTPPSERKRVKEMLSLMLMWFRDAMIIDERIGADERHLVHVDYYTILLKFVAAFESIDFDAAFAEIEQSIQMIDRNIQIQLVLIVLMNRLNRFMKLKGRNV